jgi:hypothetical protein
MRLHRAAATLLALAVMTLGAVGPHPATAEASSTSSSDRVAHPPKRLPPVRASGQDVGAPGGGLLRIRSSLKHCLDVEAC